MSAIKGWAVAKGRRIFISTVSRTRVQAIERFGREFDGYAPNGWTAIANGKAPDGYRLTRVTITAKDAT